jgi:RNA polymerase sigma-70 factor (family 1)
LQYPDEQESKFSYFTETWDHALAKGFNMYQFQYSEDELLLKIADGDEAAFAQLFYTYHNKVGAFVLGWTRSQAMTDEIVQDVFMKLWTRREELPAIRQIDSYLYIMSRNEAYNYLRSQARERVKRESWELEQEGAAETTEEQDYTPLIEKAVDRLPAQQKRVYELKHKQRMAYGEIGKLMQISPETARKHLSAAVRSIVGYVKAHIHIFF